MHEHWWREMTDIDDDKNNERWWLCSCGAMQQEDTRSGETVIHKPPEVKQGGEDEHGPASERG